MLACRRDKKQPMNQPIKHRSRPELDKMTISQVVRGLERRALLDRSPAPGRPALRIVLTPQGRRAVMEGRTRAEAASKRVQQSEARVSPA